VLQRLIVERLDGALDWLERFSSATTRETGNPRTVGRRFDPRALTDALVHAAGDVALGRRLDALPDGPVVLATGGFGARFAREHGLPLRAAPWSGGDGMRLAAERGAALAGDLAEFYGRALPAPARIAEADFVRASQLYGRFARVVDDAGRPVFAGPPSWSETDLAQAIARQPDGTAWYVVDEAALAERVRERSVGDMVAAAEELGGEVRRDSGSVAVRVAAGVTHTLGGLRVDADARVLDGSGRPIDGLYAAGVDVGGVASGGYSSGLAQALVLGLAAAESIASA
jgi:aspartate oxidase